MNANSLFRLFILGAIWGFSFVFLRLAVPALGPGLLTLLRILFAAMFLSVVFLYIKRPFLFKAHFRYFLVLGLLNTALPFFLFSYASQNLTSSMMSILNATVPSWGVVIYSIVNKKLPTFKVLLGLVLGFTGVAVLVDIDTSVIQSGTLQSIGACLLATFCYALASLYAKSNPHIDAYDNAHASLYCASLLLLPMLWAFPASDPANIQALSAVLALAILCTGIAYLLYFRLLKEIGEKVLTVTFLIPLFGVVWGTLLLGERMSPNSLIGGFMIVLGTMLIVGFSLKSLIRPKQPVA